MGLKHIDFEGRCERLTCLKSRLSRCIDAYKQKKLKIEKNYIDNFNGKVMLLINGKNTALIITNP